VFLGIETPDSLRPQRLVRRQGVRRFTRWRFWHQLGLVNAPLTLLPPTPLRLG
jgi:hypothetical protein